ncbi:uncharacterized protein PGTG_19837 [Puccinia graminis f. sp. tritici CRL 75-36-700-3]|uniref:Uncharacterized protein n=1 Tax=Puccinia graminis f. sp. tritici (strain CRL 75-36-700-3 / race SCCL) TaxID=418459 RepID=E3LB67_PUCGT|nr:uncharacterized protein PGTG_19837 [Puccinia graminis f. sp. tritici CRL 75-36-700-3]EFP93792.2 hypothetical protein PGTG_19837 [Puccinia graminis f. sp. tritici CRL 75-36-700-3]
MVTTCSKRLAPPPACQESVSHGIASCPPSREGGVPQQSCTKTPCKHGKHQIATCNNPEHGDRIPPHPEHISK